MNELLKRCAAIAALCAGCAALNGCLITNVSSSNNGGLTTATLSVTLQSAAPCTVDPVAVTTECKPVMMVGTGVPPLGQTYQFDITLLNYASPLPLYDPVIIQVPSTMSNFAGSIAVGPPGVAPGTPLLIQAGLQSIPIDANTSLTAEPGMQLVIIDFVAPQNAPFGQYTLNFQFSGTTNAIKVIFAGKVAVNGAVTYYPPIFPCVTSMSQVPAVNLPTTIPGVLAVLLSEQGCVGKQYNLAAPAVINVDQQGLTGSWYNALTSGQGIELEFFADLVAAGTAYLQGAWFTFDTTAGGADHQRWYTFAGNAAAGNAAIPVAIYQNVGGNFGAPPTTQGVAVGTGTLTLSSCTDGTFNYTFTDGSNRSGAIALTRLTKNVTCVASGTPTTNADFGFTGNWYDPATSGQGFVIEVNPASGNLFFAWYTYAANGQAAGAAGQRWYTGLGGFTPSMRTVDTTLYETEGGVFNQAAPPPQSVAVGTATITFASCGAATLSYSFTSGSNAGHSGLISLSRVGPTPAGCGP
jgi:hypothetical protein